MPKPPLWVHKAVHQQLIDDPDLLEFVEYRRLVEELAKLVGVGEDWVDQALRRLMHSGIVTFNDDNDPVIRTDVTDVEYMVDFVEPIPTIPTKTGAEKPSTKATRRQPQGGRHKDSKQGRRRGGGQSRPHRRL